MIILDDTATGDDSQVWFWTDTWQAGEVEASQQLAACDSEVYETASDFLIDLP